MDYSNGVQRYFSQSVGKLYQLAVVSVDLDSLTPTRIYPTFVAASTIEVLYSCDDFE